MRARGTMESNEDEEIKPLVYKVAVGKETLTPEQKLSQFMQDLLSMSKLTAVCVFILLVLFLVQWVVFQNKLDELFTEQQQCNSVRSLMTSGEFSGTISRTAASLKETESTLKHLIVAMSDASKVHKENLHISQIDGRPNVAALRDDCMLQQLPAWVENVTQTLSQVLEAATHTDTSLHTGKLRITLD